MRRCVEPVDVAVGVGLCMTVACTYLFFAAANGTLIRTVTPSESATSSGIRGAMESIQPALGEAIVQDAVVGDEGSHNIVQAAMQLNRAIVAVELAEAAASVPFQDLRGRAERDQAAHAGRVQFVLGRRIADGTERGLRAGVLSAQQPQTAYNRRLIGLASATADRMNAAFAQTHQYLLGGAIVSKAQALDRWRAEGQERLGRSLVTMTTVQQRSGDALTVLQEQIGGLIVVSAMAGAGADRGGQPAAFAEPRSWPQIPSGLVLGATMVLIGIFMVGLRLAAGGAEEGEEPRKETPEIRPVRPDLGREGYRKTA